MSHPSWVCGLKPHRAVFCNPKHLSHPSWVCGLKQSRKNDSGWLRSSHPSWVCGLKLRIAQKREIMFSHTLRGCVD